KKYPSLRVTIGATAAHWLEVTKGDRIVVLVDTVSGRGLIQKDPNGSKLQGTSGSPSLKVNISFSEVAHCLFPGGEATFDPHCSYQQGKIHFRLPQSIPVAAVVGSDEPASLSPAAV